MKSLRSVIAHATSTEFNRYFWAGCLTFLVDVLILFSLTEFAAINYLLSNLAAVLVGILLSYLLCTGWVFTDRRYQRLAFELPIFILICVAGVALNEFLLWAAVEFGNIHYLLAKIVVTAAVFVVNYGLKKLILFRC